MRRDFQLCREGLSRGVAVAALLIVGGRIAALKAQAPTPVAAWSVSLDSTAVPRLGSVAISQSGAMVVTDPVHRTIQFRSTVDADPVTRNQIGRVVGWTADTAIVRSQDQLLLYTSDGTLQRIVPVTPAAPSPGSGLERPIIQRLEPGDTLLITAAVPPSSATDSSNQLYQVDRLAWWQTADGVVIGSPLAIPMSDCMAAASRMPSDPLAAMLPYCAGHRLSAALPGHRLALIDAPQNPGADGSFTLIIMTMSGDTARAIRFPRPAAPVTDSMWQQALEHPLLRQHADQAAALPRPAIRFPVSALMAAPDGSVWVGFPSDSTGADWWHITADGIHTVTVHLGPRASIVGIAEAELIVLDTTPPDPRITALSIAP